VIQRRLNMEPEKNPARPGSPAEERLEESTENSSPATSDSTQLRPDGEPLMIGGLPNRIINKTEEALRTGTLGFGITGARGPRSNRPKD
jgi:hypothetical protein